MNRVLSAAKHAVGGGEKVILHYYYVYYMYRCPRSRALMTFTSDELYILPLACGIQRIRRKDAGTFLVSCRIFDGHPRPHARHVLKDWRSMYIHMYYVFARMHSKPHHDNHERGFCPDVRIRRMCIRIEIYSTYITYVRGLGSGKAHIVNVF